MTDQPGFSACENFHHRSTAVRLDRQPTADLPIQAGNITRLRMVRNLLVAAVIAAAWHGNSSTYADAAVNLLEPHQPPVPVPSQATPATAPAVKHANIPLSAVGNPLIAAKVHPMLGPPPATKTDGPAYRVSDFVLNYKYPRKILPTIAKLMDQPLRLAECQGGYVAAGRVVAGKKTVRPEYPTITVTLAQINAEHQSHHFYLSALESIEQQLVQYINKQGIIGLFVQISRKDFRGQRDIRRRGDTTVHLTIHEAIVQEVRTISSGHGLGGKKPINDGGIAFIRDDSPIQSTSKPTTNAAANDILEHRWLDDYILRLNQQPGRQVSIALSPGSAPDSVILDYLVHESKPWLAYAQISNTGTPQTNSLIEQFGFIDNQLTGHDDIFSVNYDTAGFDKVQDVNGSYQFPILGIDRLQGRIYGGYEQYNASNVGLGNLNFNGRTAFGGGELTLNIAQFRNLFIYTVLGAQYQQVNVDNVSNQQSGQANFILPYLSLRFNRMGKTSHQTGSLTALGQYTNASEATLNNLGRLNTDPTWAILQASGEDSFYIEPILSPSDFAAGRSTLANQILMRVSGQYAFGQRLIPQEESVIGGLYSVRGYPQSIVAGDNGIYGTLQYNLHIPRLFAVNPKPPSFFGHPFRVAPQTPYGRPDWDLMLSAFVDGGEVSQNHQQSYESGATLLSTGIGGTIKFAKNVSAEVDWGVALRSISAKATGQGGVTAGSSVVNFVVTVSY